MDFPKINGPTHCFRLRLQKLVATKNSGMVCAVCRDSRKLVATFFFMFLQLLSCDLMFSFATCFFSFKLISGHDMNSVSLLC